MYLINKGRPNKLSTGILKNPWNWGSWLSALRREFWQYMQVHRYDMVCAGDSEEIGYKGPCLSDPLSVIPLALSNL